MEKQKLRYYYGLMEKPFRHVYERALKKRGVTGETMLQILETRLDNVVYHLGFAPTRPAARQMITHGHIKVNGKKVNVPSYALKVNDVIDVRDSKVSRQLALRGLELSTNRIVPPWLAVDKDKQRGVVLKTPTIDEIQPIANVQAVVEFYSR